MRTFDVFDTLIARRCIEPLNIFDEVATLMAEPNFTKQRVAAEQSLYGQPHGLDHIYVVYEQLTGVTKARSRELQEAELLQEKSNAILIADVAHEIRHGDLLVSDMYLQPQEIRELLHSAGFNKTTPLYQSNIGKANGEFWRTIQLQGLSIDYHLGDNLHSDYAQPQAYGIKASITEAHAPNRFEEYLRQNGAELLARSCRELRLSTHASSLLQTQLRELQCGINIPILVMATLLAHKHSLATGKKTVLFSSRDCLLWLGLARRLGVFAEDDINTHYFYTSRLAKTQASPTYLEYLNSFSPESALILDIGGSGWSCRKLQRQVTQPLSFFLINFLGENFASMAYPAIEEGAEPQIKGVFKNTTLTPPLIDLFESLNYADHPSVLDVMAMDNGLFVPVQHPNAYSESSLNAIHYSHHLLNRYSQILDHYDVSAMLSELTHAKVTLAEMMRTLYGQLSQNTEFFEVFKEEHLLENKKVAGTIWAENGNGIV